MSRRTYSDETRAAVMAALLAGQSVSKVAREYDIPKGTVSGWKRKAHETASGVAEDATQKKAAIGDLILDLLSTELQSLRTMADAFTNPEWLKQQEAADVAVLYGVMQDKVFRKLEALTRAAADD